MNYTRLMKQALKEGFSDLEVYESYSRDLTISIFNQRVEKNEQSEMTTVTIRAIYQGKMAYLQLENKTEKPSFILSNLKQNASSLTTDEEFSIFGGSDHYPVIEQEPIDFDSYSNADKIALLQRVETAVKAIDARIVMVPYCQYQESISSVRIINSKGLNVKKNNHYAAILLQAVAREQEDSQSGFEVQVKHQIKDLNTETITKSVAKKTVAMLNAKSIASKEYPVVIENEAMSDLLSAYQSIFSGESAIKKITPLLGKEGTEIASPLVTIYDAPLKKGAILNQPFDDEGVACYDKEVVNKGVFKTFLHNLKTAKYFHTESTGNGFKAGANVGVSGTNFYIAPGDMSKEAMIASIEEGLLITALEGLHAGVNPISGDFSLKASGFHIVKGQVVRPVSLIVMAGNFFNLLKQVEVVGSDLFLSIEGIGSPSIKINKIAISGE